MSGPMLEEVFKVSGIPTHTFVKPVEYTKLIVALRTPGRGIVVEGPSGIGKTTSISKAIEDLGVTGEILKLTARKKDDRELIAILPEQKNLGTVIIDDFHRLDETIKESIADFMKTLADEEDEKSKLVIVGINKVGDSLIRFATDLNNRIDTIRFEANPEEKVRELVEKGEKALNLTFNTKERIIEDAQGSFHIAQMLCRETCMKAEVLERCNQVLELQISFEAIKAKVLEDLRRLFFSKARLFATGPKLRREGRAPYLHMLYWLAISNEWSLQLDQAMIKYPENKSSISQVVDKGFLESFLTGKHEELSDVLHYDPVTRILSVEDPKFVYFIRNIIWSKFSEQVGYLSINFKSKYDFALSFAGSNRKIAESLFGYLTSHEVSVFYDHNEQHRILAENVEDYLAPIYGSEAQFVIILLGKDYPRKIWTKFESEHFKGRFGENSIIPIWFKDAPPGMFDETIQYGGLEYDNSKEIEDQIKDIGDIIIKKLSEKRAEGNIHVDVDEENPVLF